MLRGCDKETSGKMQEVKHILRIHTRAEEKCVCDRLLYPETQSRHKSACRKSL